MGNRARQKLGDTPLNEELVYKALKGLFPRVNDYSASETNYSEELKELRDFSINTNKQLRLLLKKHRKQIIEIDRSPIDSYHQKMYREEMGCAEFNDHMRRSYWFEFPALLRLALELEFGERYEKYANERDGI